MAAPAIALQEVVQFGEIRKLVDAAGPCITLAMVLPNPLEVRTRLKNAVQGIEKDLSSSERDQEIAGLLKPIRDAAGTMEISGVWGKALLILRSPAVFQGYWLRDCRREILNVGDRFHLRPLLAAIAREQRFHALAISQGHVRLFDSTMFRAEELKLPASMPANIHDWLNARQPDHVLDNRSAGGPSTGSMKGVLFGMGADREKRDRYLRHFFKEVDRAVHTALRDDTAPLVLAGLQEELAVYRRVSTYPNLFDQEVPGSPDRLSMQDLLERARNLLGQSLAEPLRRVLGELERRPTSQEPKEIPNMAREGRIDDLMIPEDAEDGRLEEASRETLRHGGRVFAVRQAEMPAGASVVAVLRH
jgi:hypothetical protein